MVRMGCGAIVLNYVPYIGSLIASVPPALLGMLMMNDDRSPFTILGSPCC